MNIKIGTRINHNTFGEGEIVDIKERIFFGSPDQPLVSVKFTTGETRVFLPTTLAKFAKEIK